MCNVEYLNMKRTRRIATWATLTATMLFLAGCGGAGGFG